MAGQDRRESLDHADSRATRARTVSLALQEPLARAVMTDKTDRMDSPVLMAKTETQEELVQLVRPVTQVQPARRDRMDRLETLALTVDLDYQDERELRAQPGRLAVTVCPARSVVQAVVAARGRTAQRDARETPEAVGVQVRREARAGQDSRETREQQGALVPPGLVAQLAAPD